MEDQDYGFISENIASVLANNDINLLSMDAHDFITTYMGFYTAGYDSVIMKYKDDLKAFARALLCSEYTNDDITTLEMLQLRYYGTPSARDKLILKCGKGIRKAAIMWIRINDSEAYISRKLHLLT